MNQYIVWTELSRTCASLPVKKSGLSVDEIYKVYLMQKHLRCKKGVAKKSRIIFASECMNRLATNKI